MATQTWNNKKSLKKHNIIFANTPDYGVDEVADTSSALILNLVRKVSLYNNQTKEKLKSWQEEVINTDKLNPIKTGFSAINMLLTLCVRRVWVVLAKKGFSSDYYRLLVF